MRSIPVALPVVASLGLGLGLGLAAATLGAARAEHGIPADRTDRTDRADRAERADRSLSLAEVEAALQPVSPQLSRCYLDAAADARGAGHLVVQLAIHRRGSLDEVTVQTPGLPAKQARRVAACVRAAVASLAFPVRRAPTTAVVPFYFQRTEAPNAGPRQSCWSPRGCPGR